MKPSEKELKAEYRRLRARLGKTGWISHGYVQDRGPGAGGPCYQWTRKERGKTVSVALSKEQYEQMNKAIEASLNSAWVNASNDRNSTGCAAASSRCAVICASVCAVPVWLA